MITISEVNDKVSWCKKLTLVDSFDFNHTWDFHDVSKKNGEGEPVLFDVRNENGGVLFPVLVREIPNTNFYDVTSTYGYPSPLIYGDGGVDFSFLWNELIKYLYDKGFVSFFLRSSSIIEPNGFAECLEYHSDIVYIDVSQDEQSQLKGYRNNHKRDLKKQKKIGVVCFESNDHESLVEFVNVYEKTMMRLNASSFYFFSNSYYDFLLNSKDFEAKIYLCKLDGVVLCGGLFIFCNKFVQYYLGGTNPDFVNLAPTKTMFDHVRRISSDNNYKTLVLGGGVGGNEDSLLNFKKGFSKKTAKFYLTKKIINDEVYNKLSEGSPESSFFPRYRAR